MLARGSFTFSDLIVVHLTFSLASLSTTFRFVTPSLRDSCGTPWVEMRERRLWSTFRPPGLTRASL